MNYIKLVWNEAFGATWGIVIDRSFAALGVSAVGVLAGLLILWILGGPRVAGESLLSVTAGVIGLLIVWSAIILTHLLFLTPKKLFEREKQLADSVPGLTIKLNERRHTLDTAEPVFGNVIHLLNAFRMYRVALGHETRCTVYVTAPPDAEAIARLVAQVSINTSNCATFGPSTGKLPPTQNLEILTDSIPGTIVVNAPEADRNVDRLMHELAGVLRVERGYKAIPNGRIAEIAPNHVWLQFGEGAAFITELRETERGVQP